MLIIKKTMKSLFASFFQWKQELKQSRVKVWKKVTIGPLVLVFYQFKHYDFAIIKKHGDEVGFFELVKRSVVIDGVKSIAFTPHILLFPHLHGCGYAKQIYQWAITHYTLLCSLQHTKAANELWKSLCQKYSFTILNLIELELDKDKFISLNSNSLVSMIETFPSLQLEDESVITHLKTITTTRRKTLNQWLTNSSEHCVLVRKQK